MSENMPDDAMWDKTFKMGSFEYTIKTWLLIILVVVGVYIYFTRFYDPKPKVAYGAYYY